MADKDFPIDGPTIGGHIARDFLTPIAVLRESALAANLAQMRSYCEQKGVRIAPHGKTTMSPELVARQLAAGAWGMTAATAWQARKMIEFGARRVIVANICIDPIGLRWLAEQVRDSSGLEVLCFADSITAVRQMRGILADVDASASPFPTIVELGFIGGRCGARTVADAVVVGHEIASAPELRLAGVGGFEGAIGGSRDTRTVKAVNAFLSRMRDTALRLMDDGRFAQNHPVVLTAGGSAFFDSVVDVLAGDNYPTAVEVVLRSGCYLTHDHGAYAAVSPGLFQPALEVWSRVISTPEPDQAILDAGRRDVSFDAGLPTVIGLRRINRQIPVPEGLQVERLNDQHAFVRGSGLEVGDLVMLGISHPCTTFDKWRAIPVVDDDYRVLSVAHTEF